jgi:hypothetical protein
MLRLCRSRNDRLRLSVLFHVYVVNRFCPSKIPSTSVGSEFSG